jgi:phosphoglycerate dehydrogenase-like enzyme
MPRLVVDLNDVRPIWAIPEWALQELRAALPEAWEMVALESSADGRGDGGPASAEALRAVQGAEVYLGAGIPEPLFNAATEPKGSRLRWVHSVSAGVRGSLYPAMRRSEVLLTNSAAIHAPPMAEMVIAMALYFARGLDLAVRAQAAGRWDRERFDAPDTPVREIAGATLGVVGFGGIGREVARRAAALGMQVLATKRTPTDVPEGVELLLGTDGLHRLLERSDFVVLTVPETAETRGLIGTEALARLRPDAVLINVARGGIVDETALIDALRGGSLRGAALDVFAQEPLPEDSPLWGLPNVLITPHVSATTHGFWRREVNLIVDNLHRYLAGQPLRNVVDKRAGY